jgi:hypothetical protein
MGKTTHESVTTMGTSNTAELGVRRRHGRAVNAVADYLRSHLRVPNVYLEPSGPGLSRINVLAMDAAGSGDIHAVEVKLLPAPLTHSAMIAWIDQIKKIPAHFKYLALNKNPTSAAMGVQLYSSDGIGRVGLLFVSEPASGSPQVEMAVKPERFRVSASELSKVERFLARAQPDIFVRV